MHQLVMPSTAFLMLLLFAILDGMLSASAFPVSRPESDISVDILGGVQRQGSTPTPVILLPRDNEPSGSNAQPSSTNGTTAGDEGPHSGLDPNIITAIVIGATLGALLLIAAFMYAFRVGWEKGQQLHDGIPKVDKAKKPPHPSILELWHIDVTKPPKIVMEGNNSCWDSGSWTYCEERTEKFQAIGERYSFRPGRGVYEIGVSTTEDFPEFWSKGESFNGPELENPSDRKGKGPEKHPVNE